MILNSVSDIPGEDQNAVTPFMKGIGYGKGYRYAHDDPQAKTDQIHLPEELQGRRYYRPNPQADEGFDRHFEHNS